MPDKSTYCTLCVQIATLRAFGYSDMDLCSRIVTLEHPAGISAKTIYNHIKSDHAPAFATYSHWLGLNRREQAILSAEVNVENIREELEKDLGIPLLVVKNAVLAGDTKMALWQLEQVLGKAKQPMQVGGSIMHTHRIQQTEEYTLRQDAEIERSAAMVRAILGGSNVYEAEIVEES